MSMQFNRQRRRFLVASAASATALTIGFVLVGRREENDAQIAGTAFRPNAWLRIDKQGEVTVIVAKAEMGQGVWTALPMLVAEELEVNWLRVHVEQASSDPAYGHQITGGSSSVRSSWDSLRTAGATARVMLVAAAARTWQVPPDSCHVRDGIVRHAKSGRRLAYSELVQSAAGQPVPEKVALKDPADFRVIGRPLPRVDIPDKIHGRAQFGLDVAQPGALVATVSRCPVFGGRLESFESGRALAIDGVRQVFAIDRGVAVVADNYWAARKGQEALEIKWDEGPNASLASEDIQRKFVDAAGKSGVTAQAVGDFGSVFSGATHKLKAQYDLPFQAHATMEPMCCTAHVRDGRCELWVPTQSPTEAQKEALPYLASGLSGIWRKVRQKLGDDVPSPVTVHTSLLGGGFGRRLQQDYVAEAVQIAKRVGQPVKLVWSREEDMRHDLYRPATHNRLEAGLDARGRLVAWHHKIIGPSINDSLWPGSVSDGHDPSLTEGAIKLPYDIPNFRVDYVMAPTPVPLGFWRSVGHSHNAFVTECFIDELATAAGRNPLAFRLRMLGGAPRARAVLQLAADKAGWDKPPPAGRYRGLALHHSYRSYVAQVAEVSVGRNGQVRVHRVVCAIDCGMVVNPDIVAAQMEGSVVFGLTAALKGSITVRNGRIEQGNFQDYPLLRMSEMPQVETHIVASREPPGGVGEPGVPPIAPAVVNAIFAATGKRLRRLPIRPEDLRAVES